MFDGFEASTVDADETTIFIRRKWAATASVAWISGNPRDVARRRADAWGRVHSNLRGPTRLWGKWQTAVDAMSRTVLEGCNGAGYGPNDGAPGLFAIQRGGP
jgi:hypothetical protein